MSDKKIKVNIKSDGTIEGTSLMINGVDITKETDVTNIHFTVDTLYDDSYVYISWSTQEKDENDVVKTIQYRYNPQTKRVIRGIGKKIGDSVSLQFESDSDKRVYDSTGITPKSEQRIEIIDVDKIKE